MTEVYDYIVSNFPIALMSIMLIPLGFFALWRFFISIFRND